MKHWLSFYFLLALATACSGKLKTDPAPGEASITGTGPLIADGMQTSTISIQLVDQNGVAFVGAVPTFTATDSDQSNVYGPCSISTSSGNSTCTLTSLKAETKLLSLTSPFTYNGGSVQFLPAPQNKVIYAQQPPATAQAGANFTGPIVEAQDPNGNVETSSTNVMSLSAYIDPGCTISGPGVLTVTPSTVAAVAGIAAFTSVSYTKTGNLYLKVTSPGLLSRCSTATLITPAAPKTLLFATQPGASAVAGINNTTQPSVIIEDMYANLVTTGTGNNASVTLAAYSNAACSTAVGGTLSATQNPLPATAGVATFSGVNTTVAKPTYFYATSPGLTSVCSSVVNVVPNVAYPTTSSITGTSNTAANQVDYSIISIVIKDQYSNVRIGDTPTFSATNTGSGNIYGACSSTDGTGSSTCKLYSNAVENKTLFLINAGLSGGTVNFVIPPTVAQSTFTISSGPLVADNAHPATVSMTLLDASSNPVVGVTPRLTVSGSANSLSTCPVTNSSGVSTCTLNTTKAETKNVSMTQPLAMSAISSVFVHGAANKLAFTVSPPSTATVGNTLSQTPHVQIQDFYGNLINDGADSTLSVTLAPATNNTCATAGMGTFSVTTNPQAAVVGDTSFDGISYTTSGPLYLKATASGMTQACSSLITESPGAANTLHFFTNPASTATAGVNFSPPPAVEYLDVYGNRSTTTSSITLSKMTDSGCSSPGTGTLTATTNPLPATSGLATFANMTYSKVEPLYLQASGGGLSAICSPLITMSPGVVSSTHSSITGTSVTADGTQSTITIVLADAYSNPIVGVTPTFSATNTGGHNIYGGCGSTDSTGTTTCTLASTTAETKVLQLLTPASFTGGSVAFTAGAPTALAFTTQPSASVVVSQNFAQAPQVSLVDANGNKVTSTPVSVTLTAMTDAACSNPDTGNLTATQNPMNTTSGTAAFASVKYDTDNTIYLMATGGGYALGCSNAIDVHRWAAISNTSAPSARYAHTATWTGTKMVVWGGMQAGGTALATGALYNPTGDTWSAITTSSAPTARANHTAVWTGSKIIIWGGNSGATYYNTGAIYDPTANTWTAMTTTSAPTARSRHAAVWTGSKMIVWGGDNGSTYFNTGAIYDPTGNTWTALSTSGAPTGRSSMAASWNGTQFIAFGGNSGGGTPVGTGVIYDTSNSTWSTLASSNEPSARMAPAFATGTSNLFVFGGDSSGTALQDGGAYNFSGATWTSLPSSSEPSARRSSSMVSTGTGFWIWGGEDGSPISDGAIFDGTAWTALLQGNHLPSGAYGSTAVWSGTQVIIWGGCSGATPCGTALSTGSTYTP